jgi:16S rRNA (guanine966-N2)-methyltransferase
LRIVGGEKKGFVIKLPKNFESRPTTDYAKEGLFNILANEFDFEGLSVLDLFAGSGSMSYEFASRGASVTTVEILPHYCQFIKKTNFELDFKTKVVHANVFNILKKEGEAFDVIFADPPYTLKGIELIPELVFANNKLKDNGVLIVEHGAATKFGGNSLLIDERNYGSVHFSFFSEDKK